MVEDAEGRKPIDVVADVVGDLGANIGDPGKDIGELKQLIRSDLERRRAQAPR